MVATRFKVEVYFHQDFIEVEGDTIRIGLRSKPVAGKANKEIIEKISSYFRVPKSKVRILAGYKSRSKVVEVDLPG